MTVTSGHLMPLCEGSGCLCHFRFHESERGVEGEQVQRYIYYDDERVERVVMHLVSKQKLPQPKKSRGPSSHHSIAMVLVIASYRCSLDRAHPHPNLRRQRVQKCTCLSCYFKSTQQGMTYPCAGLESFKLSVCMIAIQGF
jgi:hypothetical protein